MIRVVWFLMVVLFVGTVVGLFKVNYKVQNLKKDLAEIHRQLATDKAVIHVLNAEWAYLNEPSRIKKLSDRYLDMQYIKVSQLKDNKEIRNVYLARANTSGNKRAKPTLRPILSSYSR